MRIKKKGTGKPKPKPKRKRKRKEKNTTTTTTNLSTILKRKLGPGAVFESEIEIESHSFDALRVHRGYPLPKSGFPPSLVVTPKTIEQLVSLVNIARNHHVPLYPWGSGTGLMGGAVALSREGAGGIVTDFRKMNRVLGVSEEDGFVTVQAGARIGHVNRVLKQRGLMLGHDPWTRDYATIGGCISTNGMGYYGGKYGSMGDQVLGLKVVLAEGKVIQTPTVPYSSTGLDLRRLFIGTEGTLGLIVEATLKCFPIPELEEVAGFSFPTFEKAFGAALEILRKAGLDPASLDIKGEGYSDGPCELYLVFSGLREEVRASIERSSRIFSSRGGSRLQDKEASSYWTSRHDIAKIYATNVQRNPLSSFRGEKSFDFVHVALPASRIIKFKRKVSDVAKKRGITIEEYGIWIKPEQFNFNFTRRDSVPEENLRRTVDDAVKLGIELGGTIEYCHGVGFRLGEFMPVQLGRHGFEVVRKIKRELDPLAILNPGKLGFGPP